MYFSGGTGPGSLRFPQAVEEVVEVILDPVVYIAVKVGTEPVGREIEGGEDDDEDGNKVNQGNGLQVNKDEEGEEDGKAEDSEEMYVVVVEVETIKELFPTPFTIREFSLHLPVEDEHKDDKHGGDP